MDDDPMLHLFTSATTDVRRGAYAGRAAGLVSLLALFSGLVSIGAAAAVAVLLFVVVLAPLLGLFFVPFS